MTKLVKISEAKTHLSTLLVEIENGAEFIITRNNEPVARVSPMVTPKAKAQFSFDAMIAMRDGGLMKQATQEEIAAWKHEGHQY